MTLFRVLKSHQEREFFFLSHVVSTRTGSDPLGGLHVRAIILCLQYPIILVHVSNLRDT